MTEKPLITIRSIGGEDLFTVPYDAHAILDDFLENPNRLDYADLSGLQLAGACITGLSVVGASFRAADLYWGAFYDCRFVRVNFCEAEMNGTSWRNCVFEDCNFSGCTLLPSNLGRPTSFVDVDFRESDLNGVVWGGAEYSALCKFPPGFDPVAAGLRPYL